MANRNKNLSVKDRDLEVRGFTKEFDSDGLEEGKRIRKDYLDGPDEPAENVHVRHPNRNTDKPDIDKPPYS